MNGTGSNSSSKTNDTIEKLTNIKYKLMKYYNLKESAKVITNFENFPKICDYLNELSTITKINLDILKKTEIVECLKMLKKKQDPVYSKIASDIISKWKAICNSSEEQSAKQESEIKKDTQPQRTSTQPSQKSRSSVDLIKQEPTTAADKKQRLSMNEYKPVKKEYSPEETELKMKLSDNKQRDVNKLVNKDKTDSDKGIKLPIVPLPSVPLPTVPLENILSINSTNKSSASSILGSIGPSTILPVSNINSSVKQTPIINDDEALSQIMMSKHSKRMLYTGKKQNLVGSVYKVPKLFDLSVKVLIDNMDELPNRISIYNAINDFPIAFDLIKPVIEKANSKQLSAIELHSPNLIDDTDFIWKKLCEQEFKQLDQPEEEETWREFYYRKLSEREEKFKRARDIVSKMQANKPKERQTQMATVRFVSSSSKSSSSSVTNSSSSYASKLKTISGGSGPIRKIVHDAPTKVQNIVAIGGPKRQASGPAMSQGMRATMKLIKKRR